MSDGDDDLADLQTEADTFRATLGKAAGELAIAARSNENTITIVSHDTIELIWRMYVASGFDRAQFLGFLTETAVNIMRTIPEPILDRRKTN